MCLVECMREKEVQCVYVCVRTESVYGTCDCTAVCVYCVHKNTCAHNVNILMCQLYREAQLNICKHV